jgi:protein ImuB
VESYVPERAWTEGGSGAVGLCDEGAQDDLTAVRPLLLGEPEEIGVVCEPSDERLGRPRQFSWAGRVYRLAYAVGPERIGGEWWRGRPRTRDYYDVEDEAGRRFWIFRVTDGRAARWFMQGRF